MLLSPIFNIKNKWIYHKLCQPFFWFGYIGQEKILSAVSPFESFIWVHFMIKNVQNLRNIAEEKIKILEFSNLQNRIAQKKKKLWIVFLKRYFLRPKCAMREKMQFTMIVIAIHLIRFSDQFYAVKTIRIPFFCLLHIYIIKLQLLLSVVYFFN